MTGPGAAVGARVRGLRLAAGMTLSALAEAAGIGKGTLSELENGTRNPTLDTLYAVAGPLGVPLAALLEDRDGAVATDGTLEAVRLHVHREAHRTTEVYLVRLDPGARRSSPAHPAGTTERVVVLHGSMRVEVGDGAEVTTHDVGAGETVEWAADRPHRYACTSAEPVGAVDVIVTPTSDRVPSRRRGRQP